MSVILLESVCPRCGVSRAAGWTKDRNIATPARQEQARQAGWQQVDGVWTCGDCVEELAVPPREADVTQADIDADERYVASIQLIPMDGSEPPGADEWDVSPEEYVFLESLAAEGEGDHE